MKDFLAAVLEWYIQMLYDQMAEFLQDHWDNTEPTFNNGQVVIYYNHMYDTWISWLMYAGESWPDADADQYASDLFSCYDYDVMERAFSECVMEPVDLMWNYIHKAQELAMAADMLAGMPG